MSSINTDAAVILNVGSLPSKSGNEEESDRGAPEIGKAYYINRNLDECASSLSSLSGGITNISKLRFATLRDGSSGGDVEQGSVDVEAIFREDSIGRGTSEGDGSSMSSLTNDLAHRGGNARFSPFARLSKFQVQLDDVVDNSFDYDDAYQQQERGGIANNGVISSEADSSPWYSVQAKHVPLQPGMVRHDISTQESTKTPATSQVALNAPESKVMNDKKHLEELVQLPPTPPEHRGKKSSRRVSDDLDLTLDGSLVYPTSEYTRGSGWSEDFATYVRRSFDRTSRRRRYLIGFVVVLFLLCVMAMVVASLGAKQGGEDGVASYQEVAKPQDDDRTIELTSGTSNSSLVPDESPSASDMFLPEGDESPSLADGPSTAAASTVLSTQTTMSSTQSSQEEPSLAYGEGHDVDSTDSSHQSSQPPTNATTIATQQPPTMSSSQAMDDPETQDELVQGSTQASATSTEAQVTGEPETTSTTSTTTITTTTTSSSSTSTTTPKQPIVTSTVPPLPLATTTSTATTTPPPPPETTTSTTTTSTTTSTTTPGPTLLSLSALADTSVFKNRPDKSYHAQSQLTVKGQRKASSFLMFDTSRISRNFVARATLSVYSIIPVDDDGNGAVGGLGNVNVDLLPTAGRWNEASVTFDNPVPPLRSYGVGSFSVEGYPYSRDTLFGRLQKKHDVDVTMAFRHSTANTPNTDVISFMLYSEDESNGRVDFASTEWNNGFAKPELVIVLSDTASPTISPTTKAPTTRAPTPPPTPPPTKPSVCELDCNAEADEKFEKELGFVTLADWVDDCRSNPACDRKCKDKCPQDAEKEALKASRKRNEHLAKCLPKCLDANGVPLAPERYQLFNSKKM